LTLINFPRTIALLMSLAQLENQVVSKKRVTDHGEVYTSAREVNALLAGLAKAFSLPKKTCIRNRERDNNLVVAWQKFFSPLIGLLRK
jgi:hypothetical protein